MLVCAGAQYSGEYVDDHVAGFGVMQWPDGRRYEGYFKDEVICGKGIFTNSAGDR